MEKIEKKEENRSPREAVGNIKREILIGDSYI